MNKLLTLSFILLLTGCGIGEPVQDPRTIHGVDATLQQYVNVYLSYKGSQLGYDIPMQFADLPYPVVGLCTMWSNGYRQLQIDRTYWANADEDARQQVIFHELGHCDLDRGHIATYRSSPYSDWQTSIMNPYAFELQPDRLSYYIPELFHENVSAFSIGSAADTDDDCVHHIKVE